MNFREVHLECGCWMENVKIELMERGMPAYLDCATHGTSLIVRTKDAAISPVDGRFFRCSHMCIHAARCVQPEGHGISPHKYDGYKHDPLCGQGYYKQLERQRQAMMS